MRRGSEIGESGWVHSIRTHGNNVNVTEAEQISRRWWCCILVSLFLSVFTIFWGLNIVIVDNLFGQIKSVYSVLKKLNNNVIVVVVMVRRW
jgi:hypothetical protein